MLHRKEGVSEAARLVMDTLADLGNWPSIEIGSHSVIRHAYQNVLNACARIASFATGGPTKTDGPDRVTTGNFWRPMISLHSVFTRDG
jgi:hypothetical protein